jgi:glycosyltransferase involved in cell wall biosynthesis
MGASIVTRVTSARATPVTVLDVSPAVHRKAGLGRYAEELLGALVYADKDSAVTARERYAVLYHDSTSANPSPVVKALPQIAVSQTAYPWRFRALLSQLSGLTQNSLLAGVPGAAVFHATEHLLPRFTNVKTVFTLHDLIFRVLPKYHLWKNRLYLNVAIPLFLRRADAIICVSDFTKRDAIKMYGVPEEKMTVIHEGVHPRFARVTDVPFLQQVREQYNLPERFILSLGTIEPRKNYITLIKAFAEYRRRNPEDTAQLIIVGKQGWLFEETYRAVHENGQTGWVRFLGNVEDEALPAIYSLATVFALASIYEGFGFPPLEALACGAPVLCANSASLPEIVGSAGLLIDPLDVRAWADALERQLSDSEARRALAARGPRQATRFTWPAAANQTRAIYQRLAADRER